MFDKLCFRVTLETRVVYDLETNS